MLARLEKRKGWLHGLLFQFIALTATFQGKRPAHSTGRPGGNDRPLSALSLSGLELLASPSSALVAQGSEERESEVVDEELRAAQMEASERLARQLHFELNGGE